MQKAMSKNGGCLNRPMFISTCKVSLVGLPENTLQMIGLMPVSTPVADVPLHFITGICFQCFLDLRLHGFTLRGTFMTDAPSDKVYLFLFPPQVEILDGQLTVINPPDAEKSYWAFDPAGLDQLTHEIAEDIGLPTPKFVILLEGLFLEEKETHLIREFHAAKGFDPESQDAAIAMGYPLVDIESIKKSAQEASLHSTILLHAC
jgi:hypothetical protein